MPDASSSRAPLRPPSLTALWRGAERPTGRAFDVSTLETLPDAARRYLTHAIQPGTHLATAVRLRMRGEIKLRDWLPFKATQVIAPSMGMRWEARVGRFPLVTSGFDVVHEGRGAMRWRLLGLIPVMTMAGPDIDQASTQRLQAELVWLPSALLPQPGVVAWAVDAAGRAQATCTQFGWTTRIRYETEPDGRLRSMDLERWGNPDAKAPPVLHAYGARVEAEASFGGYRIPTQLSVAWAHARDDAYEEREYFRGEIVDAEYRT